MRIKPKSQWHNFDFSHEKRLGRVEVAISLNRILTKKFLTGIIKRVVRKTGIRFKFVAEGAQEIVWKDGKPYLSYQLFSKNPYIYPDESPHTNRYDSPYSRVEFFIPLKLSPEELERLRKEKAD